MRCANEICVVKNSKLQMKFFMAASPIMREACCLGWLELSPSEADCPLMV